MELTAFSCPAVGNPTDEGEQSRGGYVFELSNPVDPPERPLWGMTLEAPGPPSE
jgi:hypothetical protein